MGSFVVDLTFRTERIPVWGETLMGSKFKLGPGGKGSNQAVTAARAGDHVSFVSKLGPDPFGDMAHNLYRNEGIDASLVFTTASATGVAAIIVDALGSLGTLSAQLRHDWERTNSQFCKSLNIDGIIYGAGRGGRTLAGVRNT